MNLARSNICKCRNDEPDILQAGTAGTGVDRSTVDLIPSPGELTGRL